MNQPETDIIEYLTANEFASKLDKMAREYFYNVSVEVSVGDEATVTLTVYSVQVGCSTPFAPTDSNMYINSKFRDMVSILGQQMFTRQG